VAAAAARAGTRSGGSGSSPSWTSGAVSVNDGGGNLHLATAATRPCRGLGPGQKPYPFGPITATPSGAVYFLESVHRSVLSLAWRFLSGCKTLTFWLGDGGTCGVVPLVGGVALEARAMFAMVVANKVEA
jgi:hypothetical protein